MPVRRFFNFYIAKNDEFGIMCDFLLEQICADKIIVRLVFFGNPADPDKYYEQLGILYTKIRSFFKEAVPPFSFIAQKPLNGELLLEVCYIDSISAQIGYHYFEDIRYITVEAGTCKELIIGGIMPDDLNAGTYLQALSVFGKINSVLSAEGMPVNSIVRQWNYIENITCSSSGKQNYQEFNRARAGFYNRTTWNQGYPAATGIGIKAGGVIVETEAIFCLSPSFKNLALNNNFQVPAYQYSNQVIVGDDPVLSTPKFERARLLASPAGACVYISGTAAIRGENSVSDAGVAEQTRITMDNIFNLISAQNLKESGWVGPITLDFEVLIIYLKSESDYTEVKEFMNTYYPEISPAYLLADICRNELLVEIEAHVLIK